MDPERNSSGFLIANRKNFPRGIQPIVAHAHARGLLFGLCKQSPPRLVASPTTIR